MLIDSLLEANIATRNGGGISGGGNISGSTLQGNTAADGGGIYSSGGTVDILDSDFFQNSANDDGGAIYGGGIVVIRGSELSQNIADRGGAISLRTPTGTGHLSLRVEDSQFHDNQANRGGGISAYSGVLARVHIADSVFSGNSAVEHGGGVDLQGDGIWTEVYDTDFTDNSANRGGGVNVSLANFTMAGGSIRDNTAADGAGAFLAYFPSTPISVYPLDRRSVLTGVDISGNVASLVGGGIRADHGHVSVIGGSITNNSAQTGGAIYAGGFSSAGESLSDVTLEYVTLSGNKATLNGGAVASLGSDLILKSSTITANHADGLGGAVYAGSRSHILNSTISGNTANLDGGGIYAGTIYSTSHLTISNSTLVLNRADADGNGSGNGGGLAVGSFGTAELAELDPGRQYRWNRWLRRARRRRLNRRRSRSCERLQPNWRSHHRGRSPQAA